MRAAASRFSASARCLSRAGGFARPIATSGSVRASDGADVVSQSPVVDPRCASTTRLDSPRRSARTTAARRWSARRFCSDGRPPFGDNALPTTTRAVVFDAHGHPSRALRVDEAFPVAPLGPEDVLVRFSASPVNPSDANVVEGTYPLRPRAFPAVGGGEGVAEVVRFGARVDRRSLVGGDELDAFAEEDAAQPRRPVKVVPDVPGSGTWREFAVFPAAALRRVPARLPDELAAQMCVNLPTALRLLQDFADLGADFEADGGSPGSPGSPGRDHAQKKTNAQKKTVVLNAPTSAVGRAAVQMCAARGVPVVCALRARETDDAWERDARYLKSLGASLVVRDAAGGFRTRAAAYALGEMPPVALALNGVGGASSAALAGALAENGVMVTYGGMARAPAHVPTGAAIFKNVTARGFWLTRWSEEARESDSEREKKSDSEDDASARNFARKRGARGAMFRALFGMVDRGELAMPTRAVGFSGFLNALNAREGKVGEGKMALWTSTS